MFYSEAILDQVADAYRRVRNTLRFLLTNLQDFDPAAASLPWSELREVDRWALLQLDRLVERMTTAFDNWDLHLYYHEVHSFCARELSSFYLDVLKDTLYTDLPDAPARRSAQTAMWRILQALCVMSAPVLTFTTEEAWQQARKLDASLPLSIQMAAWPEASAPADPDLVARWDRLLTIRETVMQALEEAKTAGLIRKPLEAQVTVQAAGEDLELLRRYEADLPELFIVSRVTLEAAGAEGLAVHAVPAEGEKCGRCWMRKPEVGTDAEHPELCARCASRVRKLGL
jgi:isoleucyl-tRNA synthetase